MQIAKSSDWVILRTPMSDTNARYEMSTLWSPLVGELEPYTPGEQPQIDGLIKLNTNESPYPPSPEVSALLTEEVIAKLRLYPDPNSKKLKNTIANYYGVKPSQVFVGNGSDEILALAFMAFFQQEKAILFPDITYSFYPVYCNLFRINYEQIPLKNDFTIDLNEYKKPNGGIIFPNPNAPTAIGKPLAEIENCLRNNTQSVVLVDEAYVDFGAQTATSLIDQYENLLVVQTLSKSRSLAGMRVGLAIGNETLIEALEIVKNSFNSYPLDRIAEAVAIAAFEDKTYFIESTNKIIATREWTINEMKKLGFTILPSQANFIFAKPEFTDATSLTQQLRDNKILVRHFKNPRIVDYLRITIGTPEEMQQVIKVIKVIKELRQ
jgi:histidinol-phosphate aminotransferase